MGVGKSGMVMYTYFAQIIKLMCCALNLVQVSTAD